MALPSTHLSQSKKKPGLALWMERVLEECDRASMGLLPDPVHDLRVALRRCRSLADGMMAMDPYPAWKQLKKAGRSLFRSLGSLRDVHVMQEWVGRLGDSTDTVTIALLQYLSTRELQLKQEAAKALVDFDRKQWKKWGAILPRRAARLRPGNVIFLHLALERWSEAHELHRKALRNRSKVAFHSLRIGLKRFRYIVENFLPQQHAAWSDDLKELQDLLGEVHDLDVLWATALQVNAFPTIESRSLWHSRIIEERTRRIEKYRGKMLGENSLWPVWRAALPSGKEVAVLALKRLKLWASALDPDFQHSNHVTRLALQLYDGLPPRKQFANAANATGLRGILQVAALLHDVGRSKREKGSHKATYQLMDRLRPPLGWSAADLHLAAVVSRYHRGTLPDMGQAPLRGFNPSQRQSVVFLAGILRLADAFDADRSGRIQRLHVEQQNNLLVVTAQGYSPRDHLAEGIAAARHLLEMVYGGPLIVKQERVKPRRRAA